VRGKSRASKLNWAREIAPEINRVLAVFDRANRTYAVFDGAIERLAPSLHLRHRSAAVTNAADIEDAIDSFAHDSGGGWSSLGVPSRRLIVKRSSGLQRATICPRSAYYARIGGLISYGVDGVDLWRRAATYVDRILRGAKPADLPVQTPTKFDLVINLKTAACQFHVADAATTLRIDPIALLYVATVLAQRLDSANKALLEGRHRCQSYVCRLSL
jgi:putative ABC transport system substrate-binding protein